MKNNRDISALLVVGIVVGIVAATLSLSGCLGGGGKLESDDAKMSYALGLQVGQTIARQELNVKEETFMLGLRDGMTKAEPKLSQDEIRKSMMRAQEAALKKQEAVEAQQGKTKQEGEDYLKKNKGKAGVKTTASGLQYEVLKDGTGAQPKDGEMVEVQYVGTLLNGKKFDASADHGGTSKFNVNQVIPGWTEALKLMKVGSKWKLTIPAPLAYAEAGAPPDIPPHSVLIFEVELLGVESSPKSPHQKSN